MFNRYLNVIEDKHAESSQIEGEDDSKAKETKYSSWTGNPIAAVPRKTIASTTNLGVKAKACCSS